MSLREQQDLLARLYTDPTFRQEFYSKPQEVGREFDLSQVEVADLCKVTRDDVKRFSDSLIWKRLREVAKMLPATKDLLGDAFENKFFEFAPTFNAQGIKKHYEDAVEFSGSLISDRSLSETVRNTAKLESTRMIFVNESKIIAACRLKPGLFSFAVWLRIGGRVFHFTI